MPPETPKVHTDLPRLMDGICEAFTDALPGGRWSPHDGMTFCNEAVNYVCKALGYTGFDLPKSLHPTDAVRANDMFDIMSNQSGDWFSVTAKQAQDYANDGALVIAAWKNSNPSLPGHVAIVRPGVLAFSGSWKSVSPKIMNVGKDCFIAKKASWAFREEPMFFALKSSAFEI